MCERVRVGNRVQRRREIDKSYGEREEGGKGLVAGEIEAAGTCTVWWQSRARESSTVVGCCNQVRGRNRVVAAIYNVL